MNTYLHKKFYINTKELVKNIQLDRIIIAISGGQDSVCLIKLIQDFKNHYHPLLKIEYIYIDHQWKKDSKNQVKHLSNFIRNIKEKIYIYQLPNIAISETKARKLRYQLIIQHSMYYKNCIIITAHTETDQIETFWIQIMRGTGIDGATSLTKQRLLYNHTKLLRPMINFKRIDIHWFCRKFCLPIWSDITNYIYSIDRNRLRYELMPYLKKYFQYNIEKQIYKFLDNCNLDNEYIKQNTVKLYLMSRHPINIAINYSIVQKQHLALQKRTLQAFFYHNINIVLNYDTLSKLIEVIKKDIIKYNNIAIFKNINITIHNHWIYIY
uniref:tRNA(Ile)-lysidine synthase n=1 Tax=Riquetophycus sp. TaxID=1897556 RepID=A0A1C9C874_9FLOR|nr:tRNA(Ile)-lysidine synthase [Riquetophycus sp.]